jgi:3-hydroxyisobutyrate dehydrogenase-like beta-hydroxyacid dehydrogenase
MVVWQWKSMVMNLLKAGFEVSVFNRKEKEAPLLAAGANPKQFARANGNL